jgi:outer membrane protein TolC
MYKSKLIKSFTLLSIFLTVMSCKTPALVSSTSNQVVPETYSNNKDTTNMSNIPYKKFFKDKNLQDLIGIAINNNQELMITLQEIEIAKNDIQFRKGRLLPTVNIGAGAGVEKVGRFTSQGAGDDATSTVEEFPDPLTDFKIAAYANWEVDIWKKLRNSKKAALTRYLSTIEGKNFVVTNLVAEVADNYYELLSLDSQLEIVRQNIKLQTNALEIVKIQKEAARATELAVQKFQAEVLASKNLEFETLQRITETENRINFLLGRFPQEIKRDKTEF